MADSNNYILFLFGLIFLCLGAIAPLIQGEFNQEIIQNNAGIIDETAQGDISGATVVSILSGIFFWVFGAPVWLNLLITMMRIVFWVIIYDKIRGI